MQETIALVLTYVRMVWRFRWLALIGAFLVSAAGWVGVVALPNVFEVKTRVFLDTRSLLKPILKGLAVDTDVHSSTAQLMRRTLLVRPNLEEVARKTDMDLAAKTPEDFERMLDGLATEISVQGTAKDNIFLITYQNENPKLATKVVEAILNIFVEKSLRESRKDTSKTRQFIDRQITEYESRLDAAEERLKEFKQRNFNVMPNTGSNYYQRLGRTTTDLAAAEQALREANSRAKILQQQLEGQEPTFGLGPAFKAPAERDSFSPFDSRISELQASLDRLLLQFTDRHPDVTSTKRLMKSIEVQRDEYLQKRVQEEADAPPQAQSTPSVQENPVYQELQIEFGKASVDIAVQGERVKRQREVMEDLQSKVDTIFKVEAELKRLNRDYDINKKNFEALLVRREFLKLGEEAGQSTDNVQFNVLEPPREPVIPIGPNRPRLSSTVFVVGLGVGIGLALLLAMVRPGFYSKDSLNDVTDLPVLGTISRIWTRRELFRRRMEVVSFAGGCMALVIMFAGLMALYAAGIDIHGKVMVLGQRLL